MKQKIKFIRLLIPFLCIIFMLCFSKINVKAEDDLEELIVGVPVDRCPIFYIDKNSKEITGIGVDLMEVAAENAGYA